MKRIVLVSLLAFISCVSFAQKLEYKIMQTGSIKMDDDDMRNLDGLSIVLFVAKGAQDMYERLQKELAEEQSKLQPDQSKLSKLREDVSEWEKTAKVNRIGREETMNCTVEYIFDSQNKLKIIGKTQKGDVLFEFGNGHNQELYLFGVEDGDNEGYFDIAVYDHGGGGLIGVVKNTILETTIFIGSIKKADYIEFVDLYVMPNGALNDGTYTAQLDANQNIAKGIRQRLKSAFPKDKDGDRWMLCK